VNQAIRSVATWADLKSEVEAEEGILTVEMGLLRDVFGVLRLGRHVVDGIHRALIGEGLGHFPESLPEWQGDVVRLYQLGSPTADLIDAVLHPSETHDEELRDLVRGDSRQVLEEIRLLVCP
jgi:hypothetical protein